MWDAKNRMNPLANRHPDCKNEAPPCQKKSIAIACEIVLKEIYFKSEPTPRSYAYAIKFSVGFAPT
jgi:hypothetical protein